MQVMHVPAPTARLLAAVFFCSTLVLAVTLAWGYWYVQQLALAPIADPEPLAETTPDPLPSSPLLVQYQLDLPGRGEIFPALVAAKQADYWPVAVLNIVNTSERPVVQTVSAEVRGWSERWHTTVAIGPQETRTLRLNPPLLPKAYQNEEIRRTTLEVEIAHPGMGTVHAETRSVFLHGAGDLYWGRRFANAQFVARWVTPHDPAVLRLVSAARRHAPGGRMAGYNQPRPNPAALPAQVRTQAQAVFNALKQTEIGYVSSIYAFGAHIGQAQRIRLPRETLELSTANCMDVSVAFASAMENLGLHPVLVIVPGHAFVGVRHQPQRDEILYLDMTVLPRGNFQDAIRRAQQWLKKTPPEQVVMVDVAAARALGIYPMPLPDVAAPEVASRPVAAQPRRQPNAAAMESARRQGD